MNSREEGIADGKSDTTVHMDATQESYLTTSNIIIAFVLMSLIFFIIDTSTTGYSLKYFVFALKEISKSNIYLVTLYFSLFAIPLSAAPFPAGLLAVAGGFIFAHKLGFVVGFIVATIVCEIDFAIGGAIDFYLVKYYYREEVLAYIKKKNYKYLIGLDKALVDNGFRINFLFRLSPLFPHAVSNYGLAALDSNFPDYMNGMIVGTFPHILLDCIIGASLDNLSSIGSTLGELPVYLLVLFVVVSLIVLVGTTYLLYIYVEKVVSELDTYRELKSEVGDNDEVTSPESDVDHLLDTSNRTAGSYSGQTTYKTF